MRVRRVLRLIHQLFAALRRWAPPPLDIMGYAVGAVIWWRSQVQRMMRFLLFGSPEPEIQRGRIMIGSVFLPLFLTVLFQRVWAEVLVSKGAAYDLYMPCLEGDLIGAGSPCRERMPIARVNIEHPSWLVSSESAIVRYSITALVPIDGLRLQLRPDADGGIHGLRGVSLDHAVVSLVRYQTYTGEFTITLRDSAGFWEGFLRPKDVSFTAGARWNDQDLEWHVRRVDSSHTAGRQCADVEEQAGFLCFKALSVPLKLKSMLSDVVLNRSMPAAFAIVFAIATIIFVGGYRLFEEVAGILEKVVDMGR